MGRPIILVGRIGVDRCIRIQFPPPQAIRLDNKAEMLNDTLFSQVVLLTQGYLSQQENIPHDGYQSVPFHLAEGSASH